MSNATKATDKILADLDPARAFLEKQEMRKKIMEAAGVTELFTFIACSVSHEKERKFACRIQDMPNAETAKNVAEHLFRTDWKLKQFFKENAKYPHLSDFIMVALDPMVHGSKSFT